MKVERVGEGISIPEQHYVGIKKQTDEQKENGIAPLGFMTPDSTNKAAEKRKDTIHTWLGVGDSQRVWNAKTKDYETIPASEFTIDKFDIRTMKNELLSGFRISKEIKRIYWGGGNVVWRVEDPRGFELEISSNNLARIMDCTTVVDGVIQGKCIWGRLRDNILIPENSDVYQDAIKTTDLINNKVSLRDVKIGDIVLMKDGYKKVFYGTYHITMFDNFNGNLTHSWNTLKRGSIFKSIEDEPTYEIIASPKISKIVESKNNTLDSDGVIQRYNFGTDIDIGFAFIPNFKDISYRTNVGIISESKLKPTDYELIMEPVDINAYLDEKTNLLIYNDENGIEECKFIAVGGRDNYYVTPDYPKTYGKPDPEWIVNECVIIEELDLRGKKIKLKEGPRRQYYSYKSFETVKIDCREVEWYILKVKYQGKTILA